MLGSDIFKKTGEQVRAEVKAVLMQAHREKGAGKPYIREAVVGVWTAIWRGIVPRDR
jgi:hypothetical protein